MRYTVLTGEVPDELDRVTRVTEGGIHTGACAGADDALGGECVTSHEDQP